MRGWQTLKRFSLFDVWRLNLYLDHPRLISILRPAIWFDTNRTIYPPFFSSRYFQPRSKIDRFDENIEKKKNTIFILTWQSIIRLKLLIRLFARSYRIRFSPVKNALDKKLSSSDSSSSRTKLYVYTYNHIWSSSLFVDISYVCLFIRDADALKRNKCGRTRREGERGTILLFHRGIKFGALSALIQPRLPI